MDSKFLLLFFVLIVVLFSGCTIEPAKKINSSDYSEHVGERVQVEFERPEGGLCPSGSGYFGFDECIKENNRIFDFRTLENICWNFNEFEKPKYCKKGIAEGTVIKDEYCFSESDHDICLENSTDKTMVPQYGLDNAVLISCEEDCEQNLCWEQC